MLPEAMRHYSAAPAAVVRRQPWIDGLVLLSTVLFGVLISSFILGVLPSGGSPKDVLASFTTIPNPLERFLPAAVLLPAQPVGSAQDARSVVAQVAEPRRSAAEAGREPGSGQEFLVVTAVVDNQGSQPFAYDLSDWKVFDSEGRAHEPVDLRNAAGWLSAGRVDAGQSVRGALAFAVPQGDPDLEVRFGPRSLRTIMRWDLPSAGG
jgi:hypothetical protein